MAEFLFPMPQGGKPVFSLNGVDILADDGKLFSLVTVWEAADNPSHAKPWNWVKKGQVQRFIRHLASKEPIDRVFRHDSPHDPWGCWQLIVMYVQELSPAFREAWNKAAREFIREELDPNIRAERLYASFVKQGKSERWAFLKVKEIEQRNIAMSEAKAHGLETDCPARTNPYASITNAFYRKAFGADAGQLRAEMGLPAKANVRNDMDELQLSACIFGESLAVKNLDDTRADCFSECHSAFAKAGNAVGQAFKSMGGDKS